jgi:hypothetical protein
MQFINEMTDLPDAERNDQPTSFLTERNDL